MRKLFSLMRSAPKRTSALFAMIGLAAFVPLALNAWGPDRPTFTIEKPASYVTFNSITNNPAHGDERNFMQVREATASDSSYADNISLSAGKEYVVFMYYHNDAAANLKLVALNSYAKVQIPAIVANGSTGTKAVGYIGASNANPKEVWDDISFSNKTGGDISLRYVQGSATIHSKGAVNNKTMSDNIITSGAPIGYDSLDGKLPGCHEFAGYITFRIKADQPNFTVTKSVKLNGTSGWKDSISAKPGDTIDYLIEYKNTGTMTQKNVTIKDKLPKNVTYMKGSAKYYNSFNPNGAPATDDITGEGLNIGNYNPNSNGLVRFSAKIADESALTCGENKLVNTGIAETDNGWKQDTATVTVTKDCPPPAVTPIYTCDSLTVTKLERTKFKFDTKYTVKDAVFKNVTYVIKDANDKQIYSGTNAEFSSNNIGKYSVQATVNVTVDGQAKSATSTNCKKEFEIVKEKTPAIAIEKKVNGKDHDKVNLNTEFTYQLTVTNTGEADLSKVKVSDNAPQDVQFISADKGEIKDNKWSYTIDSLKIGQKMTFAIKAKATKQVSGKIVNTACVDTPSITGSPDDCDDASIELPKPAEIQVCELSSKQIVSIKEADFDSSKHSKNLADCEDAPITPVIPVTPTTPGELPTTGLGDGILAFVALGSLVMSVNYYVISRRALGAL